MLLKTKILLVDDYKENITALAELIAADDVETYSALNAEEALELIANHEFGLVLLDVQMPGTSGFELAKIIRSVNRYRSLPIIFVTAHREDSLFIFEGYKSGAVDLLFKPLDSNMVRAKVRMFVELAQQKALLQMHVKELERLRIEADAANIAKSQFLANMSHEIRTPLAAVMGFAELITRGQPEDSEARELSLAVERNGNLLMRLIDDILDLSKIEANRLELERTEFSLEEVIQDIQSTMSFRAKDKGLTLIVNKPKEISHRYITDVIRLKQILLNIIGNAIKFTPSGKVTVDIQLTAVNDKTQLIPPSDHLSVKVTDQGVGLSSDSAERLFKPFGQADPSTRRNFGGSGLGLVISRQLARAMGGEIRLLHSSPGGGSTFLIELNLEYAKNNSVTLEKPIPSQAAASAQQAKFNGKTILAVDDSPDNLTLISLFLRGADVNLTYAENGIKAIEEVSKNNFDLILMDVQMPGMDGHEATEKIRKMGFQKPIVALTAHAIKSEHDKCRQAGCNSVLTKPITQAKLVQELHSQLL